MEPFFTQLISGIQAELSQDHTPLLFSMAEDQDAEIAMYRSWWAQRRVDGVFLVDLQVGDRRVAVLEELKMPAVVIGTPAGAGSLPAVWQDDAAATRAVVEYLAGAGHQRIARVTGIPRLWHTKIRTDAFRAATRAVGLEAVLMEGDYTGENGAKATVRLLEDRHPPTAIVYDNDLMAVSGLGAAQQKGVEVPAELSIVAWDDSRVLPGCPPAADRADPGRGRLRRPRRAGPGPGRGRGRGGSLPGAHAGAHRPRQHGVAPPRRGPARLVARDPNDTASPLHQRARKA